MNMADAFCPSHHTFCQDAIHQNDVELGKKPWKLTSRCGSYVHGCETHMDCYVLQLVNYRNGCACSACVTNMYEAAILLMTSCGGEQFLSFCNLPLIINIK